MSLELHSISGLYLNSLAQIRISNIAFGRFLTSSIFIIGIRTFYLLREQDVEFAKRSFTVGGGFICVLSVAFYGDQNGLQVAEYELQKWLLSKHSGKSQKPPAASYLIAFPNQKEEKIFCYPYSLCVIR